ncbi:hypothetical protein GDO81_011160 [Engystomops pustulosus]|uniref:Uncharacterized protein n=1 Tax=Engystomops pustulosus TaxID=76066 RepID=A0AAV7BCT1_ENGPU|nr:hypothetical protein GDO81_011160 [Engystomops pustulosus]
MYMSHTKQIILVDPVSKTEYSVYLTLFFPCSFTYRYKYFFFFKSKNVKHVKKNNHWLRGSVSSYTPVSKTNNGRVLGGH